MVQLPAANVDQYGNHGDPAVQVPTVFLISVMKVACMEACNENTERPDSQFASLQEIGVVSMRHKGCCPSSRYQMQDIIFTTGSRCRCRTQANVRRLQAQLKHVVI